MQRNKNKMKQFKTKILSNKKIKSNIYELILELNSKVQLSPGEFFNLKISKDNSPLLRRPFGYADYDPQNNFLKIIYQIVGKGTLLLSKKPKDAILDAIGPLGNSFSVLKGRQILIGGGVGIAPLYPLAKEIKEKYKLAPVVVIGTKTKKQIILEKDFKKLGCKTFIATEDASYGLKGFATDILKSINFAQAGIYACGPMSMYKTLGKILPNNQFCEVLVEEKMACGFGVCQGCTILTKDGIKLVCKDGPVFRLSDLVFG